MRIEKDKLNFFQELYHEACAAAQDVRDAMRKHREQYKGSAEIDGSDTPARQIRNITYELIESQVTGYIPSPNVTAKTWSERDERNAKSIETLLNVKRNELPFERMNDLDERFSPIYGGSVWLVEWDDTITTHSTAGDVRVTCLAPHRFTGQPNIYDVNDMEYCFVEFTSTREEIEDRYGISVFSAQAAEMEEGGEHADDHTVKIIVCYYRDDNNNVCEYIWSGDVEISDVEDFYARKHKVCRKCGRREGACECEKPKWKFENDEYEELDADVQLSDGTILPKDSEKIVDGAVVTHTEQREAVDERGEVVLKDVGGIPLPKIVDTEVSDKEKTLIPWYKIKKFPIVIRKNTSDEDSLFGQSDCEFIRPQQQGINKLESRIMEKLLGGGVYPIVPKGAQVDLDNTIFKKVFRVEQKDRGLYGTVDLQVDISRDSSAADRLYDQAKRQLGISASFQGQHDASAVSGRAKQLQIQQAAGRLDSKRKMKNAAYAEIDELIFKYYLAYADEPRKSAYKDAQGRWHNASFNRYDFVKRDENGEYYYDDEFLFSADSSVDLESQRELLWEECRKNYQSGAYGDTAMPETQLIFWQNMERAHYPFARENAERISEVIAQRAETAALQDALAKEKAARAADAKNRDEYESVLMSMLAEAGYGEK